MISIEKHSGRLSGIIDLTPSKSITNRVLIIQKLAGDKFEIINLATARDSGILKNALDNPTDIIDVRDAGTAFRFLTAYLTCINGRHILTGTARMQKRPVGELVEALKTIGANISFGGEKNFPPLIIDGKIPVGGEVQIDSSVSSQFISALLLIAPVLENGLKLEMTGNITSRPYIDMTIEIMRSFGIEVISNEKTIEIKRQKYISNDYTVENDWSAASFWYMMCAMSDEADVKLKGLGNNSIQGDSVIYKIMHQFGVQSDFQNGYVILSRTERTVKAFEYNFNSCPDLVIPVAVLCAGLHIDAELTGVKNLRLKESDRLEALKIELTKCGSRVEIRQDSLLIHSGKFSLSSIISSHNDHRIAMAFAAMAMVSRVSIDDETVVRKSYPEFWEQMGLVGFHF